MIKSCSVREGCAGNLPFFNSFSVDLLLACRRMRRPFSTLTRYSIGACGLLWRPKIPNRRLKCFSSMFSSHRCGTWKLKVAVYIGIVVCKFSPIFSLLHAQANISAIVFSEFSFQSLNLELCFYGPYCYYIGFDLFQFRPSIEIDYILEFQ